MGPASDHIVQSPTTFAPDSITTSSPTQIHSLSHLSQPDMPIAPAPVNTTRRRRPSKGASSAAAGLKRSVSTPNIRRMTAGETAMSLAEKRRNKLGYHRTSVACVHCRRRKIRCLLAPDDPQNRCSNCIRLKKDCNFYPVDQQPPVERRPRAGSRIDGPSGGNSASSSSSPGLVIGQPIDHIQHFNHYPMLPISAHPYSNSMVSMSAGIISPPSSIGPQSTRTFEFPPHHHDRSTWEAQLNDHVPLSAGHSYSEDHSHGHWKESPITPGYSPYTTGPPNSLSQQPRDMGSHFLPFGGPRNEPAWPVPTRSMSYGHLEDLSHQYSNSYHQPYPIDPRRRASEMHPPSLQTSTNSSNASMSDAPGPPMSAPLTSQPLHQYSLPQASWNHHPAHSPLAKMGEFGAWFPDAGQLAKVQEEEVGPQYGTESATLYSSAGHH